MAMRTKQQVAKCCPPLGVGVTEDLPWTLSLRSRVTEGRLKAGGQQLQGECCGKRSLT